MKIALFVSGCAALCVSGLAGATQVVDQDGSDVTVLRMEYRSDLWLDRLIDLSYCQYLGGRHYTEYHHGAAIDHWLETHECASQVANHPAVRALPIRDGMPVLVDNGRRDLSPYSAPLILVDLLIPDAVLATATSYGFSMGSMGGTVNQFPVERLHDFKVRAAVLRDGSPAGVYRFFIPFQKNGSGSECEIRGATFKPYLGYLDRATDTLYRKWDNARGTGFFTDYSVVNFEYAPTYRCLATPKGLVDRTAELLAAD